MLSVIGCLLTRHLPILQPMAHVEHSCWHIFVHINAFYVSQGEMDLYLHGLEFDVEKKIF